MYVFCCSYAHNVAANDKWIAFVSTTVETASPEAELAPGLALLGHIDEKFVSVSDVHVPTSDGSKCVGCAAAVLRSCSFFGGGAQRSGGGASCWACGRCLLLLFRYLKPSTHAPTQPNPTQSIRPSAPPGTSASSAPATTQPPTLRRRWRMYWTCTAASPGRRPIWTPKTCGWRSSSSSSSRIKGRVSEEGGLARGQEGGFGARAVRGGSGRSGVCDLVEGIDEGPLLFPSHHPFMHPSSPPPILYKFFLIPCVVHTALKV